MLLEYLKELGFSHNNLKLKHIVIRDDFSLALTEFTHWSLYGADLQTDGREGPRNYRAERNFPAYFKKTFRSDQTDILALGECFFSLTFLSPPFGEDDPDNED
jgi:hypothetical protein